MQFLSLLKSVFTSSVKDTSSPGQLDKVDAVKLLKHVVVVSLSAGLTALAAKLNVINLGEYTVALVPVLSLCINAALKWLKDNDSGE